MSDAAEIPLPDDVDADATTVAVAPAPAKTEPDAETRTRKLPPYNVIILNDEDHTFEYVIELLIKIFKHPKPVAEALTHRIHTQGRAVVFTTHKEHAELKRDQVLAYGPDPLLKASKTSLGCYIEPAP
jgi:ATP-dependent Clp protease adaptor protein ClpS